MKIALFHNPKAGNGTCKVSEIVRQIESAGHKVLYVSIKEEDWEEAFGEPIDRAIIAGGDGSVRRIARRWRGRVTKKGLFPRSAVQVVSLRCQDPVRYRLNSITALTTSSRARDPKTLNAPSLKTMAVTAAAGKPNA